MEMCTMKPIVVLFLLLTIFAGGSSSQGDKPDPKKLNDQVKEIAGTAEFLRSVPKHFATLQAIDPARNQVTLLIEGEVLAKVWSLVPDAEVKVQGWWGRLGDFTAGDRVWAWFKTDRKKQPVAISMLADEISEQDLHGGPLTVKNVVAVTKGKGPPNTGEFVQGKGKSRFLNLGRYRPQVGYKWLVQSTNGTVRLMVTPAEFEKVREGQKSSNRQRWTKDGLPGTVSFVHIFSGEMDLMLDHEAMRWGRSLKVGDKVTLVADPPIKALVKKVQPWRERTQVRLVVHSFDLADLNAGQRIRLLRPAPPKEVETALFPPDLDQPRTKAERLEWFLASIYCTCGVRGSGCTGHFYTLASCNPNACGMPRHMRNIVREKIDQGLSDRRIMEDLLKEFGPNLLKPHLLP
jgi:hypothetical protein